MTQQHSGPDMGALADLVPVTEAKIGDNLVPTANARELHAYLEVRRDFSNWIKARIQKYGFADGVDFISEENLSSPKLVSSKARPQRVLEYHLTLDMAKELAMVENNPKGRQARRYFIECEKRVTAGVRGTVTAPAPADQRWAEWLSLSTDERRTRQKEVQIDTRLYGAAGGRYTSFQVGRPIPPKWVLTACQQHELELARREAGLSISVTFPLEGWPN